MHSLRTHKDQIIPVTKIETFIWLHHAQTSPSCLSGVTVWTSILAHRADSWAASCHLALAVAAFWPFQTFVTSPDLLKELLPIGTNKEVFRFGIYLLEIVLFSGNEASTSYSKWQTCKNDDGNAAERCPIKPQVHIMLKQEQNASQLNLFSCVSFPLRIERGFMFYIFICPGDCYTMFNTHIYTHT